MTSKQVNYALPKNKDMHNLLLVLWEQFYVQSTIQLSALGGFVLGETVKHLLGINRGLGGG